MPAQTTTRPPWGKLRFTDGSTYQLTGTDVLWTARATVYEGGDPAATLWTLTQRFDKARRNYSTFASFVRAFSQPVNPRWASGGEFCGPGGTYAQGPYCSEDKLRRRAEASTATLEQLADRAPGVVQAVIDWARASLPNPVPRATNFADPAVARTYLDETPDATLLLEAGNWYIVEPWAQSWRRNKVVIEAEGRVANAGRDGLLAELGRAIAPRLVTPISVTRAFRAWRT